MKGATDLLASERGIFCLVVLMAVTVLAVLSRITGADWLDFVKWLTITLVASKTLTGAVETIKGPPTLTTPPGAP